MPPVYTMSNSSESQWKLHILLLQNILNPNPVLGDIYVMVQFVAGLAESGQCKICL